MTDSEQSQLIISSAISAALLPETPDDAQEEGDTAAELELRQVTVPVEAHGGRLDRALAGIVPEFSRNYLQQLIEAGMVSFKGKTLTKASTKVKAGDALTIELRPTPQSQAFKPEVMALDIV